MHTVSKGINKKLLVHIDEIVSSLILVVLKICENSNLSNTCTKPNGIALYIRYKNKIKKNNEPNAWVHTLILSLCHLKKDILVDNHELLTIR